jgi:hypothetical protein
VPNRVTQAKPNPNQLFITPIEMERRASGTSAGAGGFLNVSPGDKAQPDDTPVFKHTSRVLTPSPAARTPEKINEAKKEEKKDNSPP